MASTPETMSSSVGDSSELAAQRTQDPYARLVASFDLNEKLQCKACRNLEGLRDALSAVRRLEADIEKLEQDAWMGYRRTPPSSMTESSSNESKSFFVAPDDGRYRRAPPSSMTESSSNESKSSSDAPDDERFREDSPYRAPFMLMSDAQRIKTEYLRNGQRHFAPAPPRAAGFASRFAIPTLPITAAPNRGVPHRLEGFAHENRKASLPVPSRSYAQDAVSHKPKNKDAVPEPMAGGEVSAPVTPTTGVTTVMVRHVPTHYSQDMLLREWAVDFSFDFLCLGYNFKKKRTIGYAFVNFLTEKAAAEFRRRWHGEYLSGSAHDGPSLLVQPATIQGLRANVCHYAKQPVPSFDPALLPAVWLDGVRVNFTDAVASF